MWGGPGRQTLPPGSGSGAGQATRMVSEPARVLGRTLPYPPGDTPERRCLHASASSPPQPTTPCALPGSWWGGAGQRASLYPPWRGDPHWAGLATPSTSGRSGLLAGSSRDLQPHKQSLLEPELMVEKPGGQCPAPRDGGRERPGRGGPAAPRSCMLGVGVGGMCVQWLPHSWVSRVCFGVHACAGARVGVFVQSR